MAYTIVKNNIQIKNIILSTYKYLFLDEFPHSRDPQDPVEQSLQFQYAVCFGGNTGEGFNIRNTRCEMRGRYITPGNAHHE